MTKLSKTLEHPEMMRVIHQIVEEMTAVCGGGQGAACRRTLPRSVVSWTQEIRDIHTSMYDDWKAGRQTEID